MTLLVLDRMRELLEQGWTQGTFATTREGAKTPIFSDDAACFCVMGALHRAVGDLDASHLIRIKIESLLTARLWRVTDWNDAAERTQAQVVGLIDWAISRSNG